MAGLGHQVDAKTFAPGLAAAMSCDGQLPIRRTATLDDGVFVLSIPMLGRGEGRRGCSEREGKGEDGAAGHGGLSEKGGRTFTPPA
ncbi:hypothetical protein ABIF75_006346 [Bradyrhizobium japonicum]